MTAHLSLTSLQADLVRRGLPRDYVDRVVAELRDHQEDVSDELAGECSDVREAANVAASRLGDHNMLARQIVSEYRARFFSARHPVLTYLLSPLPALVFAWVAYVFVAASASLLLPNDEWIGENLWVLRAIDLLLVFAVPLIVAAFFCRLARRACVGVGWAAASTALIALVAFSLRTQITPPTGGPGTGSYMMGLGVGPYGIILPASWRQALQAALPCVALATYVIRNLATRRQAQQWAESV